MSLMPPRSATEESSMSGDLVDFGRIATSWLALATGRKGSKEKAFAKALQMVIDLLSI